MPKYYDDAEKDYAVEKIGRVESNEGGEITRELNNLETSTEVLLKKLGKLEARLTSIVRAFPEKTHGDEPMMTINTPVGARLQSINQRVETVIRVIENLNQNIEI